MQPEWDKTFKITNAAVDREGNGSVLRLDLDAGNFTAEIKFFIEHPDMELQQSGQWALSSLCEFLEMKDVEDSSEFIGKTIDLETLNTMRRYAKEHVRLIYPEHLRRIQEQPTPPREIPSAESDRYVYVISCVDTSKPICKIGIAGSPEKRVKQLSTSSPHALRLEFARLADDARGVEASAHAHFADKRQNGEWFSVEPRKAISFVNDNIDKVAA